MSGTAGDLLEELGALLAGEADPVANAANMAALLFARLPGLNWAGFYILRGDALVLGPFQGLPACTRIAPGRGVCGTAFAQGRSLLVDDVHDFDGHIACDAASRSEIVVPFATAGGMRGVLDLDSPHLARFTQDDRLLLEAAVRLFEQAC